jgi:DsbC/DsbD-like thiol-disulfide interchange protein
MKTSIISFVASLLPIFAQLPAHAQSTASYLPEVEASIVQGWRQKDGTVISALRISMQNGWKTYWRTPGDGGIPPRMEWTGSRNLKRLSALWPAPRVFVDNGMTSYGYEDELLLPMVVTPRTDGKDVVLKGNILIGVCKDICVPVELSVDETVFMDGDSVVSSIAVAMAEQPFSAKEARVSEVSCRVAPAVDGMSVVAKIKMPSAGGREYAVIETGNPELWVPEASVSRDGRELTVMSDVIHAEGKPFFLQRSDLDITVIGADYAVTINGCKAG